MGTIPKELGQARGQGSVVPTFSPGLPSRKTKGKCEPAQGLSGRRPKHISASRPSLSLLLRAVGWHPCSWKNSSCRPARAGRFPEPPPRVWARPGLVPSRRRRGPNVKALPNGGEGSEPGCARTCVVAVPRWGPHPGRGPGPRAPRAAASPGGPAASVTSRGGASAAPPAQSCAPRAQRRSRAAGSASRGPDGAVQR